MNLDDYQSDENLVLVFIYLFSIIIFGTEILNNITAASKNLLEKKTEA